MGKHNVPDMDEIYARGTYVGEIPIDDDPDFNCVEIWVYKGWVYEVSRDYSGGISIVTDCYRLLTGKR